MTDLAMGQDRWTGSLLDWDQCQEGRHALDEDALLTPIFHALKRGGWRERQHEPTAEQRRRGRERRDPLDEFRRDPLTAPIPEQAFSVVPEQSYRRPAHLRTGGSVSSTGRHHRVDGWH